MFCDDGKSDTKGKRTRKAQRPAELEPTTSRAIYSSIAPLQPRPNQPLAFETWPTFVKSLLGLRDDCDLVDRRLPHGLHDDGDVVADGELVVELRRGTRLLDLC